MGHFLNLHEYWGDVAGPASLWGWHSGRVLQFLRWLEVWGIDPEEIPIRFGEIGFDRLAVDPGCASPGSRGYRSWMTDETYIANLAWLLQQYAFYPSIKGGGVFGWDAQNREWNGFDIRPARSAVVAMVQGLRAQAGPSRAAAWGCRRRSSGQAARWCPRCSRRVSAGATAAPAVAFDVALGRPLPVGVGLVSQWFGANPANYAAYGLAGHEGLDYSCPAGTDVLAAHGGVVHRDEDAIYGKHITVTNARMQTVYAHLSAFLLEEGFKVDAGNIIGSSGSTGRSSGPHLHFGWRVTGDR